jgi:hypothetical protein
MKNKLTTQQQHFIIKRLACYYSPSEIIEAFASEFGITLTSQQVQYFDPTLQESRGKLKLQWIELFEQSRAHCIKELSRIPVSHRVYRLMQLDRICRTAYRAKNYVVAMQALELAAKECGGFYEPAKPVGTSGVKVAVVASLDNWQSQRSTETKPD